MNTIIICPCGTTLTGRQRLFCSRKCKNKSLNTKHKDYTAQQQRGLSRKLKLLKTHKSKCKQCGYSKNYSALVFHHIDPKDKSFGIDLRQCSNRSLEALENEAKKCEVLCHNCHMELHHPNCLLYR